MRRRSIWVTTLAAAAGAVIALAAGIAAAREKPTVVRSGNLVLTINGGVTPKALPKHELAPIAFHAQGDLATLDGSHPPAFQESIFDIDKDVVIDVKGLPVCRKGQLGTRNTTDAENACPKAILGTGHGTVEVAFPEQRPFQSSSRLVLFNGGQRGGVTTFFIHAYVAVPAPTAIVVTVKAIREREGPYGLRIVSSAPSIAGGSGSVIHFDLRSYRYVHYEGRRQAFIFARCRDGRFLAKGSLKFRDGSTLFGGLVRPCTAVG
jgi:hypothetical protein